MSREILRVVGSEKGGLREMFMVDRVYARSEGSQIAGNDQMHTKAGLQVTESRCSQDSLDAECLSPFKA